MNTTTRTVAICAAALGAAAVLALGVNTFANAAGTTTTPATGSSIPAGGPTSSAPPAGAKGGVPGGSTHAGPGETLLTGSAEAKAKAAALAAVPGATVVRAETDSGPATYEVHLTTRSGAVETVKLDADFAVSAVQDGMGSGPSGSSHGPSGGAPFGVAPSGGTPSTAGGAA